MIKNRTAIASLLMIPLLVCSMVLGFFITSPVLGASMGDYSSSKITLSQGQVTSGNYVSLSSKDGVYLTIKSIFSGKYNYTDWYATFTLPSQQVSSLSLNYTGKYSTWRGQYIYLYNFSTSNWQRVDFRNMGASIVSFSLISIASPASYVSPGGELRVRVCSLSTSTFTAYIDYLNISATLSDTPPDSTPAPTPAPTPIPTTPTPNAVSGDYSCTGATIIKGQVTSGSYASLSSKDGAPLTVKSVVSGSYYYTDWYGTFTLPSQQVSSLSLSYTGKYSTWRGQYIYLYNFSNSSWQRVDYRNLGASIVSFSLTSIASPGNYVSPKGELRVRVFSFSTTAFTAYTDYLKIGVKY